MPQPALSLYLQDHHAGATAGVRLARRCAQRAERSEGGRALAGVAGEIEEDLQALERIMAALEVTPSRAKDAAGRVGELLSRLKPNGRMRGEPAMQRLHELEALSLGIAGKLALWEALGSSATAGFDLDDLAARARSQRERVETERLAWARTALAP
jgi:hypothetical protein